MTDDGRVLIVDDSAVNRQPAGALMSIGIDAREATTAAVHSTRSRRRRRPVGVVLLDVVMPEMDGYETLAAIKADEAHPTCR